MDPLISPAVKEDLDQIMTIEAENFGPDAFLRSQFLRALKNERAVFLTAAFEKGGKREVAGYALGFVRLVGRAPNRRLSGVLYSIAVAKKAQGMSIGKTLLAEFHRMMKAKKCAKIYLQVKTDNTAAIKMYEKFGYKKVSIIENYYKDSSPAFKYVKNDMSQGI